jgi:hypothetical protein
MADAETAGRSRGRTNRRQEYFDDLNEAEVAAVQLGRDARGLLNSTIAFLVRRGVADWPGPAVLVELSAWAGRVVASATAVDRLAGEGAAQRGLAEAGLLPLLVAAAGLVLATPGDWTERLGDLCEQARAIAESRGVGF